MSGNQFEDSFDFTFPCNSDQGFFGMLGPAWRIIVDDSFNLVVFAAQSPRGLRCFCFVVATTATIGRAEQKRNLDPRHLS